MRKELKNPGEGEVLQELIAQVKKRLALKEPFAINATNLREERRSGFTGLIDAYGGKTRMLDLQADKPTVLRRLANREKPLAEKDKIPLSAITRLAVSAVPPTALECHTVEVIDTNPQFPASEYGTGIAKLVHPLHER